MHGQLQLQHLSALVSQQLHLVVLYSDSLRQSVHQLTSLSFLDQYLACLIYWKIMGNIQVHKQ